MSVLEVLLGGLRLRVRAQVTLCLTGAPAEATVDGRRVAHGSPVVVPAGSEVALAPPASGLRTYLSVRGGIDVPAVLGSRSWDTLAGLGPDPLAAGDLLPVGPAPREQPDVDQAPVPDPLGPGVELVLPVLPGPRASWLADAPALAATSWTVTDRTDRIGTRLDGTALTRAEAYQDGELPSEPMVRGAIQVPPDGCPVIFGADHPVTGGYPVVGVVEDAAVDLLAQAPPGTRVALRPIAARTSREGASVP